MCHVACLVCVLLTVLYVTVVCRVQTCGVARRVGDERGGGDLSIYLSIHFYILISIYVSIYVSMYLCIYVSMYLCIYLCIYVSMYPCIYVSMTCGVARRVGDERGGGDLHVPHHLLERERKGERVRASERE